MDQLRVDCAPRHVCSSPHSDRVADILGCPLRAKGDLSASQQFASLFDHFIEGSEQCGWDHETECFSRL